MALVKAFIPGLVLTLVVAVILGSNRVAGGWLDVHKVQIEQVQFYWTWPLFLLSTGLAWFLFSVTE